MADSEQKNPSSSETPEELARRLQSLLEESWSPTPESPAEPQYEHLQWEEPGEPEQLKQSEPQEAAPSAEPRKAQGRSGFLKKYRKERPQREKPSWYQPPREASIEEPPEPPAPIKEEEPVQPEESAQMEVSSQPEAPAQPKPQQAEAPPQEAEPLPEEKPVQSEVAELPEEAPAEPKKAAEKLSAEGGMLLMLRDLVCILAALTLLFTFVVRISRVEGSSMYPSLVDGDQLLLTGSLWYGKPQRGDIVAARVPTFSKDPIVKRVIAVEGDTVDIDFEAGTVTVNGKVLEEPYINAPTHRSFGDQGTAFPLTVEKDHVFLLGDNRNDSYDSRYASIGQVDVRCILGKASVLLWPGWDDIQDALEPGRIGLIQ